jgi:hypothetical protein
MRSAADRNATAKPPTDERTARRDAYESRVASEEAGWEGIVGECRQPKALTSCDALKAWLAKNGPPRRTGTDRPVHQTAQQQKKKQDEARQVLDAAAPAMKEFAEANLFAKLDLPGCAAGTSISGCMDVTQYLRAFPDGKHAEEARKALDEGRKKMSAKQDEEQRRADAEEKAGARRQQQASCKAACSSTTCVMFTTDDKRTKCIDQCLQGCN